MQQNINKFVKSSRTSQTRNSEPTEQKKNCDSLLLSILAGDSLRTTHGAKNSFGAIHDNADGAGTSPIGLNPTLKNSLSKPLHVAAATSHGLQGSGTQANKQQPPTRIQHKRPPPPQSSVVVLGDSETNFHKYKQQRSNHLHHRKEPQQGSFNHYEDGSGQWVSVVCSHGITC